MLKLCIVLFGWYLMITGTSIKRTNERNNSKEIPFLEKQRDYNITFTRFENVRYDKRYMTFLNVVTFKYNRTCTAGNATLIYGLDTGYDLEMVVQMYRFASNEYRQFPCRFQVNFCSSVEKNVMGLGELGTCGGFNGCPLVKGREYRTCNFVPNPAKFPPFIPSGEYMFEMAAMYGSIEMFVIRGNAKVFRPIPGSE